jgi:hypothetical protein
MNGNGTLTAQLRVGVSPELKRRLKALAIQQHRTLSGAVRVLLEEALELEDALTPSNPERSEYEISLTIKEATRLVKKGYDLQVWEPQYSQMSLL